MSWNLSEEVELIVFSNDDNWNSANSIAAKKNAEFSKSDFTVCLSQRVSNCTFKELEIYEWSRPPEPSAKSWDAHVNSHSRFPLDKSWLRDEMEILKINLSSQDKMIGLRESVGKAKLKRKRPRKFFPKSWNCWRNSTTKKLQDLTAEIEGSETAKKDTRVWKFLQRATALRKELANGKNYEMRDWLSLDFYIQNTKPLRRTCPNCTFFITTNTKKVATMRTRIFSLVFAIIGICIASFALYSFKDVVHLCPLCRIYLGFCPAMGFRKLKKNVCTERSQVPESSYQEATNSVSTMVSASSTSAKNLFVESKLRLSDRVQVNVNNIAAIARQIQKGSKANENLITAAKNFALQEAAIENSETNLKKLRLLTTHLNTQVESVHNNASKMEIVLEQVRSMQR